MKSIRYQTEALIFMGVILVLLGLIMGLFIPLMTNPRMGLSTHLEGLMNGMLLVLLGLIWQRVRLTEIWLQISFLLAMYGSFANFLAVLLAALSGLGGMMPLAGGRSGEELLEVLISFLLISLALAMLALLGLVLSGLFKNLQQTRREVTANELAD